MVRDVIKKIHWLGHDGFRIDSDEIIYFDPYQIKSAVPADIIFISHEHFDHCSEDDIKKIQKKDTVIVTDAVTAKKLKGNVKVVKPGDKITADTIAVEVVPSYNTDKNFHPKSSGLLAFIVTVEGVHIYHGGDTDDTWTLGPELFVGKLTKNSVIGLFPNHQWDVSGPKNISLTTVQPLLSYLPGGGWAISTAGQITYNWEAEQWTIPLNLAVSRTVKLGTLPVKLMLEGNYYLEQADALGQKWMIGLNITPVVRNVLAEWLAGN